MSSSRSTSRRTQGRVSAGPFSLRLAYSTRSCVTDAGSPVGPNSAARRPGWATKSANAIGTAGSCGPPAPAAEIAPTPPFCSTAMRRSVIRPFTADEPERGTERPISRASRSRRGCAQALAVNANATPSTNATPARERRTPIETEFPPRSKLTSWSA